MKQSEINANGFGLMLICFFTSIIIGFLVMHFEKPVIQPITGQYGDINSMPLIIAMILGALVGFIIGGIYIYKKEKANKKQFGKKSWKLMAKKFK